VRVLLAIDLSNQAYKACHAHKELSSGDTFTGGLYGFIAAVTKAILAVSATDIVICKDSKPYIRSKSYPEYKSIRKRSANAELSKDVDVSLKLIQGVAETLGWAIWAVPGFESDDLIAHAVYRYRNRFGAIYAMSNDTDLYQLFHVKAFGGIYRGKLGLYDRKAYDEEWGLSTEQLVTCLAMMGTHNDIAGIDGIGPVNARKIIATPHIFRHMMTIHGETVRRNQALIRLPHPELPQETPMPFFSGPFDRRALYRALGRYEIQCTSAMEKAFSQIGTGTHG
jgi:5'-3' exonuclease